ncbi:MAG: SPFH domain-containing protein [Gammaproteobacteria bacterium]|nr:SPFH domain-containing protein [Gammaproteobacteria bacterium]
MDFMIAIYVVLSVIFLAAVFLHFATIPQGSVGVVTVFGGYRRMIMPGFNWTRPWERSQTITLQNRAMELEFKAITVDQANVYFNCTLLYSVADNNEETIKRAAFSFASLPEFSLSLRKLLEDETRSYVATKRQAEMIGISQEVVFRIKANVDARIERWGYRVEDLRYNNIHFDEIITTSMARVVAAINERDAAENEGQALLIRKTKEAEADGSFIKIKAEAERVAWKLRGQGLSDFRREVATGIHFAVDELVAAGVDPNYMLFFMYTETLKYVAENSSAGHTIFLDTNPSRPRDIMEQMSAFYRVGDPGLKK